MVKVKTLEDCRELYLKKCEADKVLSFDIITEDKKYMSLKWYLRYHGVRNETIVARTGINGETLRQWWINKRFHAIDAKILEALNTEWVIRLSQAGGIKIVCDKLEYINESKVVVDGVEFEFEDDFIMEVVKL